MTATITQAEYERKRKNGCAGPGRPMDPNAGGVWWLELDPACGTALVYGEVECSTCGGDGLLPNRNHWNFGVPCPQCKGADSRSPASP